jgi:hypothetical protein
MDPDVVHKCYPGFIHGFYVMTGAITAARVAVDEACELLRAAFTRGVDSSSRRSSE